MAGTIQSVRFSSSFGTQEPPKPKVLFVQGVADDGLIRIASDIPNEEANRQAMETLERSTSGAVVTRHVLGSLNHFEYFTAPDFDKEVLLLVAGKQGLKFNVPSAIVNCIADPDVATQTLKKLDQIIVQVKKQAQAEVPVINPPEAIARTTRDKIYDQFKDLPGLEVPRVLRFTPESVEDVVAQVKAAKIKPPFLMRSVGTHGGRGMQKIDSFTKKSELLKLERYAYDGSSYYAIQWVDFKSKDKLYRKSRIACVGGEFIGRHCIIGDDWNVHAKSREALMTKRADLRKEEEQFITSPFEDAMGKDALASLKKVHETLGLDYFGIDCCRRADGTLLIFEINAAFNTMVQGGLATYPYLAQPINRIIKAFNDLVAQKASLIRAA